ncbi:ATP-binding cassette sub-family F member 3 [Elysia marginata]|uniref:ATP-binding cassette sub-family F member 3 n=1 Tax=Elysia marginata TaxID=1093978 RepID=A0AAV4HJ94_9GAST|nr:ATP-binding cassette sub-family F member 3 [Elysia marginata]
MSQCRELISEAFPHIDHEISDYVNSMLDDGQEDFETSDDLFDAIGVMLQQADESKTEDDIKEICDRLFSLLHQTSNGSSAGVNGHRKVLDAPLQMSKLAEEMAQPEDTSIWLARRDNSSVSLVFFCNLR